MPTMTEFSPEKEQAYKDEITRIKRLLRESYREETTAKTLRELAFGLAEHSLEPPEWITNEPEDIKSCRGIPTLFISDWHWGEVVNYDEVSGHNEFNLSIARERAQKCFSRFVEIYSENIVGADYAGCVLAIGGDMVSGNIHDELTETNEMQIMPTILDCAENIIAGINKLLEYFPSVACFCVTGNHGRTTVKNKFKKRAHTSYDWLISTLCEKHFETDERVRFRIPEGPDCMYSVYNTKYLLTHGDQLGRGGGGAIGMLGPVTRGDQKRRTRQMGMGEPYDILICGHWHQLAMLRSSITNGSLKGFDEFAYSLSFSPEPPMQASWLTHPVYGVTYQIPIFCDDIYMPNQGSGHRWVGWQKYEKEKSNGVTKRTSKR